MIRQDKISILDKKGRKSDNNLPSHITITQKVIGRT
jgi:hypothetical protein